VDAETSVGVLVHDHGYSDSREIPPQEQKRKCRHMRAFFYISLSHKFSIYL
jgi:hypothetical protein